MQPTDNDRVFNRYLVAERALERFLMSIEIKHIYTSAWIQNDHHWSILLYFEQPQPHTFSIHFDPLGSTILHVEHHQYSGAIKEDSYDQIPSSADIASL